MGGMIEPAVRCPLDPHRRETPDLKRFRDDAMARSRKAVSFEKLLLTTKTPLFAVNESRVVVYFNAGCETMTGWTAGEILGRSCVYASDAEPDDVETLTSALCPPPEAMNGAAVTAPAFLLHRNGSGHWKSVQYTPLHEENGNVAAVLGAIHDAAPAGSPAPTPSQTLHAELAAQKAFVRSRFGLKSVFARSDGMSRVLRQVLVAASGTHPALIIGEAGVGKHHLARVIHAESRFQARCFVPLDCARLPAVELRATLRRLWQMCEDQSAGGGPVLESLLPGTLYLKHVDALPADLQQWVVEELTPRGSTVRMRVLGGTDVDWAARGEAIRRDFDLLLTTQSIVVPPLRERPEEIPLLAADMVEECNRRLTGFRGGVSEEAMRLLREYRWPGNVRELRELIEEAWKRGPTGLILATELPFPLQTGLDAQRAGPSAPAIVPLEQLLERVEREEIERALVVARGNKRLAADLLRIPRPRLYRRLASLGMDDGGESANEDHEEAAADM